jgi:DNA mismatch repair protein MutL
VEAIFGKEVYQHLLPVEFQEGDIRISGFASLPSFSKRNSEGIYFYVNQRFIKDRVVYKAILDGYRHLLPGNQFPIVILFIRLPPSAVDVNVHPTKTEVKFREPETVYQAVFATIRGLLDSKEGLQEEERVPARPNSLTNAVASFSRQEALSFSPIYRPGHFEREHTIREGDGVRWELDKQSNSRVVAQIDGTYVLCERDGNLTFIDQHAAHERILFEKYKKEYENEADTSEKLLLPILIELSVEESYILESAEEALKRIGFEIESIGQKLFSIRSIPTFIDQKDAKEAVRKILDELSFQEGKGKGIEEVVHSILITLACHSAIRGNFPLKREEMDRLVGDLADFHPAITCPHGRPIFFVLPVEELRKKFKRR